MCDFLPILNETLLLINALGNVDILSVAHDSELGWFSLSFDEDDDLIVEDDDEDDDGYGTIVRTPRTT